MRGSQVYKSQDVAVLKNLESYGGTVLEALQAGQMEMENQ